VTRFRTEIIGDATLICADCREVLPTLGRFDAVVTDPPYGINHSSSHGASWQNTKIAGDNDTSLRDDVLQDFETVAAFGTWKTPPIAGAVGCLVFDKGPAFGMGNLAFPWKPSFELIYIRGRAWKGRRDEGVLRGHMQVSWETQFRGLGEREARSHPHQKPVSLCEALLLKLPDDFRILDPFMGSGTTGVACVRLQRAFVGIELDPAHFDTACRRIERAHNSPRLFEEPKPKPVQEALW
jgi:DNA modification methylase